MLVKLAAALLVWTASSFVLGLVLGAVLHHLTRKPPTKGPRR